MEKFCPKCGKKISKGIFCRECLPDSTEFREVKIKLCPSGKYFMHGKWKSFNDLRGLSESLLKNADKYAHLVQGLESFEDLLEKPGLKRIIDIIVERSGNEYKFPVNVEVTYSPGMAKAGSKYFEGIIQVRNAYDDVKLYIRNYVEKKSIMINKVVEKDDYVDLFFADKKHMKPLALKLMRNFGAHIENSAQLFSRNKQTSKNIYRVNELVVIPKFKINDCVVVDDVPVMITGLGKIITGTRLDFAKKTTFVFDPKKEYMVLEKKKTQVSSIRPRLEILDPETFQPESALNPFNNELAQGQNVLAAQHGGKLYVLK